MADYHLVRLARGAAWDISMRRRQQVGWDDHAAFMDSLVESGVVILGGPIGHTYTSPPRDHRPPPTPRRNPKQHNRTRQPPPANDDDPPPY